MTMEDVEFAQAVKDREIIQAGGGLFTQWICMPADATESEEAEAVRQIKENILGDPFDACPNEYIADRMYGGFECPEPGRTHVLHQGMQYSYLSADEARYWPLESDERISTWKDLARENAGQKFDINAPFTKDFPKELVSEEGRLQAPQEEEGEPD